MISLKKLKNEKVINLSKLTKTYFRRKTFIFFDKSKNLYSFQKTKDGLETKHAFKRKSEKALKKNDIWFLTPEDSLMLSLKNPLKSSPF